MMNHFTDLMSSIKKNIELANDDEQAFIKKAIDTYYISSSDDVALSQVFWRGVSFTPLTQGTKDYDGWFDDFNDTTERDLSPCLKATGGQTPQFAILMYSYGYPDHYFICVNDVNADNPTVFSTDHEVYFREMQTEGTLQEFLQRLMTKAECADRIQTFLSALNNQARLPNKH